MVFPSTISFKLGSKLGLAGELIVDFPLASLNPTTLQFVFFLFPIHKSINSKIFQV